MSMSGNFTNSCIPHFGVFDACPERRYATKIHFVVLLAQNFFAGLILLVTLIRRVIVFKPVQWTNFYTILTYLAAGNFFMSLMMCFVINSDFPRVPLWLHAGILMIAGDAGMVAGVYTIVTWMEVLDTRTLLVYRGLKRYRTMFWSMSAVHLVVTVSLAVVAGISGELYLIFWRLEWAWWSFTLLVFAPAVAVFGVRTVKSVPEADRRGFKIAIFGLLSVGLMYLGANLIQMIWLDLIDRTPWAWHLYWTMFAGQNGLLTTIYGIWSLLVTNRRVEMEKSRAPSRSGVSSSGIASSV